MVHSIAVRKPLVAIILNILTSMFHSRMMKMWKYSRYNMTKSANENMMTRLMLVGLPAWRLSLIHI